MIQFKSIPFFKILLPYVLGIIAVFFFHAFPQQHLCFIGISAITLVFFVYQKSAKNNRYYIKWLYIICSNLFLFLTAFESAYVYDDRNNSNHYSHYITQNNQRFLAEVIDIPVTTEKSIKLTVSIKTLDANNTWHYVEGKTIVYVKKDSASHKALSVGDNMMINGKFSYVNEPKNPFEFDYKTYLLRKNVFHVAFVKPNELVTLNKSTDGFGINHLGTRIKSKTVEVLRGSGLSPQTFAICAALLVGYDDEIDKSVMQSFSHSGTLHILSVSGMHTGVLYGILVFLYSLFDKHDRFKKLKCFTVIACLLLFVFITGFSPSVLRAALMLALVLLGKTFYRQGNSYNTLLLSAFILLLTNPYLLLDVGFLLSYLAVFGIMYLYPILNNLYFIENKLLRWAWSLTLMSFSATVFTLPITLYYFHQFPIWFVFSNLVIIPLSTALMLGAVILIVTSKIIFIKQALVWLINTTNDIMLWFAQLTDNPDYGFIDNIVFSKTDVWFCFGFIVLVLLIINSRQYKYVMVLGLVTILWLINGLHVNYENHQQKELLVFYVKHKPCFLVKTGQTLYANMNELNEDEYQRFVKPYIVTKPNFKLVRINSNYFNASFAKIFHANKQSISPEAHYVIVSHNTTINSQNWLNTKPLIIADCSNSYTFVKKLKKQCAQMEVPFYSVRDEGALQLTLN